MLIVKLFEIDRGVYRVSLMSEFNAIAPTLSVY